MDKTTNPQKEKVEKELTEFNVFFKSIQSDGLGLSQWEASVVRTYLIWVEEGKPATKSQLPSKLLPEG